MEHLKKEFDELLLSGRYFPEVEFEKKIDTFLFEKNDDEKKYVRQYILEVFKSKIETLKTASEEISMLKQLNGIERFINLAKISESYFGKTKSWLYQRLHGYSMHGKPATFTTTEKETLSLALLSLSENLKTIALKIA